MTKKCLTPVTTVSAPSRYMSQSPEDLVDLEAVVSPELQITLEHYKAQGRKDVRFASIHGETAPLNCPGQMQLALKRLSQNSSPEECPIAAHAQEAYESYLDGFYEAMAAYYPERRFTVPRWEDEQETTFLSLAELMSVIGRGEEKSVSTPATVGEM